MTICYFGIYNPLFSRNKIYKDTLQKAGHTVFECNDQSPGIRKYIQLYKKHKKIKNLYDIMIVGYPAHGAVFLARILSRKAIVADLLGSIEDAGVHSHKTDPWRRFKDKIIDKIALYLSDKILLESSEQKKFFEKKFGESEKYHVVYTGVDESAFYCKQSQTPRTFIVLFRGRLTPESGILYIARAALALQNDRNIVFRVIGKGRFLADLQGFIHEHHLRNIELITDYLSADVLREKICETSLALGQFENNPRLNRTIPHKAFEAFSMGIPYLTGDAPAAREIISDNETGFLSPLSDSNALAQKIEELSKDGEILNRVSAAAKKRFTETFSSVAIARQLEAALMVK